MDIAYLLGSDALRGLANPHGFLAAGAGLTSTRGFDRATEILEREGWASIKTEGGDDGAWVMQLTQSGWNELMDGIDPEVEWSREWDGLWRTVSFDLPATARAERRQLAVWLKRRRFGHLQGSLWVSQRRYEDWGVELEAKDVDPRYLVFQESRAIGTLSDEDYVRRGWDFEKISAAYDAYLGFLGKRPASQVGSLTELSQWSDDEARLWRAAFELDPFLPEALCPDGYAGRKALAARKQAMLEVSGAVGG